jgi:hypothetical protein
MSVSLHASSSKLPVTFRLNLVLVVGLCRSQCPPGLRHEMFLPVQKLGSWVRIPLEARIFVCVYSAFVLSYVGSNLVTG